MLGAARFDDHLCRQFSGRLGITVAAVDYRLCPENPYPAAADADADGELSREALLMARAAGQIDRAPVASQIDGVLIHEGPGRRITFVA